MADENAPAPAPTPEVPPDPPENNPAPVPPAAPPAAEIVIHGTKTEREIELERQLAERDVKLTAAESEKRAVEQRAAELERDNQELKKIPATPAPKPKREKKHNWLSPVIGMDDEE